MILRPRQIEFVDRARNCIAEHGNTIGVAPTGAGKTVMLSAIANTPKNTTLILQHRDELVSQNRNTFKLVNPHIQSDIFTADRKRFLTGGTTFGMVQTLSRMENLKKMPPLDMLICDEAHHCAAISYKSIIDRAREINPIVNIVGVTATPMRGDRKALKGVFTNVCDVIQLEELIKTGHLVKPRTFVIECGLKDELDKARAYMQRKRMADYDMTQVEKIMDTTPVNDKVFEEWRRLAGDRRTVIFCSTVEHAANVRDLFVSNGVKCETVTGETPAAERRALLKRLDSGETQVITNVAVLTEGFDCQPISCIVLLRPCSYKSTMLQMMGRGLRRVDPERYPGIIKDDCIVLDFGYSLITHGNFDVDTNLDPSSKKKCPECDTIVPGNVKECPICGYVWQQRETIEAEEALEKEEKEKLADFVIDRGWISLESSPFFFGKTSLMVWSPWQMD